MAEVTLKNICKVYEGQERKKRGFLAVKDLSIDIHDEEFIVFVGPSGCGKSTTLRMVAGLEDISSGDLYIDGVYVNDVPAKDRNIAMVFQNYALYPHMTAYKNISFGLTLQRLEVPTYEECAEVEKGVAQIKGDRRSMDILNKKIVATERRLEAIGRQSGTYGKALDEIADKLQRVKDTANDLNSLREKTAKLEQRAVALHQAIERNSLEMGKLQTDVASDKQCIATLAEKIEKTEQSLLPYQKKAIDSKQIKKLRQSQLYYQKLAVGDEKIRTQDEAELAKLKEELAKLGEPNGNGAVASQKEWTEEMIGRYESELNILSKRKQSIESNLTRIKDRIAYLEKEPQPVFHKRRYTKAEINTKVMQAAEILDIKKILYRKPREMSGGQRQRVALGRAIVREPKVFLLDEPLSNLDAKLRTSMRSEIVKLHKRLKTTFIYVTHDQTEAMTMGTRIVVMKDGVVQQIDTPVNLFDHPANLFVAGFIGTPRMNIFDAKLTIKSNKATFLFAGGSKQSYPLSSLKKIKEAYADGKEHAVKVGIRAENLLLEETGKGIPCSVTNIELLGNETNVYATSPSGEDIILKLGYRPDIKVGDSIAIGLDEGKIYLFDAESTQTINE